MPVKRRVKLSKKITIKRRPKTTEWERLYNRLHDGEAEAIIDVCNKIGDEDYYIDPQSFLEDLLKRCTTQVSTLQIGGQYRVYMQWADYSAPRVYGRPPTLASVKCSPCLTTAATLAYLEICKHAGKWV